MTHPTTPSARWGLTTALLLLLTLFLVSCEEDVVANLGEEFVFTIYGTLIPQADTQFVRVFPIEARLQPELATSIDATVRSTDLTTGEVRIWKDSLMKEWHGDNAHVFYSVFRPEHDRTYRIEVIRSDGITSTAEVTVPPPTELIIQPATPIYPVILPLQLRGGAPQLIKVELDLRFKYLPGPDDEGVVDVTVPYVYMMYRTDFGWQFEIPLQEIYFSLEIELENRELLDDEYGIILLEMGISMAVVNREWAPPGNVFDPLLLAQERSLWNVRNGYGFIGAGYRLSRNWLPDPELLEAAGFSPGPESEVPDVPSE